MKKGNGTSRRQFLKIGALGLGGLVISERSYKYFKRSNVKAKIVIVGGGAAGITMAAYLSEMIHDEDITIIEPNVKHHYQPGYTMIAGGVFDADDVVKDTKSLLPRNVKWIQDSVKELNPENNSLTTKKSGVVDYDYMVLVPGGQLNFDLIEGISRKELGKGNAHCIYDFNGAQKCYEAITKLPQKKDAQLVFADTYTKIKCGGAPKKIAFMTEDYLRNEKAREGKQVNFYTNSGSLFKPAVFGDRLEELFEQKEIKPHFQHRLVSVDTYAKKAVFEKLPAPTLTATPFDANYEKVNLDYDFLHFVPPMSAPDFIKKSDVVVKQGDLKHGGWVDVDKYTMIHNRYSNIVSLGDVSSLPTSKTGAAIRIQAPIAAKNLIAIMEGKTPTEKYNGYTACPIVTEYGKVLMCEFGYDKEVMPSFSMLDPGVDRSMWWMLKKHGLKPMYYHGMLTGLM